MLRPTTAQRKRTEAAQKVAGMRTSRYFRKVFTISLSEEEDGGVEGPGQQDGQADGLGFVAHGHGYPFELSQVVGLMSSR